MNVPAEALGYGVAIGASGALLAGAVASRAGEQVVERLQTGDPAPGPAERTRLNADPPRRWAWGRRGRAAALAFAGAASAVAGHSLAGPVGGLAAVLGFVAIVRSRRRTRQERERELLELQLRDAVGVVAAATRAGLSTRRALGEALADAEVPLRPHLEACVRRLEVGEPLAEALAPLDAAGADGRLLGVLLRVHGRTGGDLPALLDDLSETIGRRVAARRQARALTAQGRASGAVLAVLPPAAAGLLSWTGGGLGAFYRSAVGSALLALALLLEVMGFLWLRRLADGGAEP